MRTIITLTLFFMFLLIRSGNSHEVVNHSDRPAISFMENHSSISQNVKSNDFQFPKFTKAHSNGIGSHGEQIFLSQDSEDFQLWKDYHLQMAFYACLIAFTFLLYFSKKAGRAWSEIIPDLHPNPIIISQRSLRI